MQEECKMTDNDLTSLPAPTFAGGDTDSASPMDALGVFGS
jgi:hypothetical protein